MSDLWRARPVFVTGGTGLLGPWLVRRLVQLGADVVCLVRDWVPHSEFYRAGLDKCCRIVQGDVCDTFLMERVLAEYEVRTVFHLAAQAIVGVAKRSPVPTFTTNIAGTWSLLEACRRIDTVQQVVVASSDKAYGVQADLPYREDAPLQGTFPYDASKSCADLITQSFASSYGVPAVITRCGNFYGGGDLNWNRIVPGTIRSLLDGERPIVRSNGKFVRDYVYVEDGAAAYILLAEKLAQDPSLAGEAFNFSNEEPTDVLGLVARLTRAMGSDLQPVVLDEATHEIPEQYLDASKARARLGWRPTYGLDEGLQHTIRWYEGYLRELRQG